jgi:alpha-beta hydrolase superfamily lysophospholipase
VNPEARGDVDHWQVWLDDVANYIEKLPGRVPRVLLGISWGGTLAAAVARQRGDLLAGVGLICPGLYSRKAANFWQRALLGLAHRMGLRNSRVTIPLQDPALFSHVKDAQEYVASDPLALRKITIRFAVANLALTRYATERPEEVHVPALAVLAGQDPITINSAVRDFLERVGHSSKRVIEYPAASHTLEFEPDPGQYYRDLAEWCRQVAQ